MEAGALAILSPPRRRRGGPVATRPVPTRVGGTGEGDEAGEPGRVWPAGPAGPAWLRAGPSGPGGASLFFFFVSVLYFLLFNSFSFSVLFNLGHLGIL